MKLKTISLLSLSLFTINSFAYISSPGAIVGEIKTNCNDPSRCGFVERDDLAKKEREKFVLKKNKNKGATILENSDRLETHAFCENAVGNVDAPIQLNAHHVINIENNSGKIERFVIKYDLYCGADEIYYERDITLYKGDYFTDSFDHFENVFRSVPGLYNVVATTSIDGDGRSLDLYSSQLTVLKNQ